MKKKLLIFISIFLCVAVTAWGQVENLATGGTAIASTGEAAKAIDGDISTRWESEHSDPQTWQVDLGKNKTFKSIVIVWETASSKDYTIKAAGDGAELDDKGFIKNGETIATVEDETSSNRYTKIINLKNAVTARYLKLNSSTRTTGWGHSFYEFYVLKDAATQELVSCKLGLSRLVIKPGENATITITDARNQFGGEYEGNGPVLSVDGGKIEGTTYTAPDREGTFTIQAKVGNKVVGKTVIDVMSSEKIPVEGDQVWIEQGGKRDNVAYAFDKYDSTDWDLHEDENHRVFDCGFVIDLKDTYRITKIVELYDSYPELYAISFSGNGETWKKVTERTKSVFDNDIRGIVNQYNESGVRYVKFHSTKSGMDYGVKIKNFELYGEKEREAKDDGVGPKDFSAKAVDVTTRTATITLKATDESGHFLHYGVKRGNGEEAEYYYTTMESGKDVDFVLTDLTPGTKYTYTFKAYDVFGNASVGKSVTFTTLPLLIKSFTVLPTTVTAKKGEKNQTVNVTVKVMSDEGEDVTTEATYSSSIEVVEGDQGVVTVGTTVNPEKKTLPITIVKNKTGHGVITLKARYGNVEEMTATVEYFVYDEIVKVQYKLKSSDAYQEVTASMGKIKDALNDAVKSAGKTYLDVYDLKFESGNLNDADIKTLREMAGGTYGLIDGKKDKYEAKFSGSGNLHVLNLKPVGFSASGEGAEEPYVITGDSTYTTVCEYVKNSFEENNHPNYILKGGAYAKVTGVYAEGVTSGDDRQLVDVRRETEDVSVASSEILPDHIFDHCKNLVKVTLPDAVKTFGDYCFNACVNLKTVDNYRNVESFGSYAFANTGLESFDFTKTHDGLNVVGTGMFFRCPKLASVTFKDDIVVIGGSAFAFTEKFDLNDGALPASLESIEEFAFLRTKGLSKVVFGEKLKAIRNSAFDAAQELFTSGELTRPLEVDFSQAQNLKVIDYRAFSNNRGLVLTDSQIPNSVQDIGVNAFCNTGISEVKLPENKNYQTVRYGTFGWSGSVEVDGWSRDGLQSVTIPKNVKYIGDAAFIDNTNLSKLTLNNRTTLETIGEGAFQNCTSLTSQFSGVTGVLEIGDYAFDKCVALTNNSASALMANLEEINVETFARCSGLTELHLGRNGNLKTINKNAFKFDGDYNSKVKKVVVYTDDAPTCYMSYYEKSDKKYHDYNPFYGIAPNEVTLDFNGHSVENYRESQSDDDNKIYGNGFLYLLTKHLRETGNETGHYLLTIDGCDVDYFEKAGKSSGKYNVANQEHADVILDRTFQAEWNSLILPFTLSEDKMREMFEFDIYKPVPAKFGKEQDGEIVYTKPAGNDLSLQFQVVSEIEANTPYIFKLASRKPTMTQWTVNNVDIVNEISKQTGGQFTFTGSYDDNANIVSKNYSVLYINQDGEFAYKVAGDKTKTGMKGFRSYFTFAAEDVPGEMLVSDGDGDGDYDAVPSSVRSLNVDKARGGDVYDIRGTLVRRNGDTEGLAPGIYLVSGRKFIKK